MELRIQKGSINASGNFEGIISTDIKDRDGEIILPTAFTKDIGKRVPLLAGHRDPCGSIVVERIEKNSVHARGRFNLSCEAGRESYALALAGDVSGLSVGARVVKHSRKAGVFVVEEAELLEVSFVPIASNQLARITAVKSFPEQAVADFRGCYEGGVEVHTSLVKAAGDPILTGSTFPGVPGRVDPRFAASAPSWLSLLPHEPVTASSVSAPRLTGFEGDAAEQVAQNTALAQVHLSFEEAPVSIPTWSASVPCSRQVLEDSPALAALVFAFLGARIVRQMESRAASDLLALANAVADADAFASCGELADLGMTPGLVLISPKKYWSLTGAATNSNEPLKFGGVPAMPSVGLTAAQGLVITFEALRFLEREAVALEVGLVDGQFTSNMRTVRGNARALLTVSDRRSIRHFSVA
jgi:HK97 family phage prohead protease